MHSLSLFGFPTVAVNGQPINIKSRKGLAMLAYLAMERRPQSRDLLAGLLWPEFPQTRARANLRRTLFNLNPTPVRSWMVTDGESIALRASLLDEVDVHQFETLASETFAEAQEAATKLYVGEFLHGFSLPDSEPFEQWVATQRARLQRQALDLFEQLAEHHLTYGDPADGTAFAQRQVELDMLRESGWRQLMRALDAQGRPAEALAAYDACCAALGTELGLVPSKETSALAAAIRANVLPADDATSDGVRSPNWRKSPATPALPSQQGDESLVSPYRGLFAFREEDAPYFFGREEFTEILVNTVADHSIVAVIGPSGSGKSSVIHAGLIPQLRARVGWRVATFRPGPRPHETLAVAFVSLLHPKLPSTEQFARAREMAQALRHGNLSPGDLIQRILGEDAASDRVLIIADQFEELYTLCPDVDLRDAFLDALLETVIDQQYRSDPNFTLVLSIRADFLGYALAHRALADAIQEFDVKLGAMTRPELTRTIVAPARIQGVAFETGLVERILDDVGNEPGNLPLLEFTLSMLWNRRNNGIITNKAYESTGRVYGALTRYADDVYALLNEEDQALAVRVFTQLVQPGTGTEDTRRIALREDLGEDAWHLAAKLANARLLVANQNDAGQETVEIVHEALIHHWDRLRAWMESDRQFRIWQEKLRVGIRQWQEAGHDESALLRGVPLAEAETWFERRAGNLGSVERQFIAAGIDLQRRLLEREADLRQRELESARQLAAEAEARRQTEAQAAANLRRRAIWLTVAGVAAAVLALVAALFGFQSNRNATLAEQNAQVAAERAVEAENAQATAIAERVIAEEQTRLARAGRLALEATSQLDQGNFDLALLLAIEAAQMAESVDTWHALRTAATEPRPLLQALAGHSRAINRWGGAQWNQDSSRVLTASDDDTAIIWEPETGRALITLAGHEGSVVHARWNQNESRVLTASSDGTARIWDAESGDELRRLVYNDIGVNWAEWSPDERQIITAHEDGTARIWDAETGELLTELIGHPDFIMHAQFSPEGSKIMTGGADGAIRIWDARDGDTLHILVDHQGGIPVAQWSRDGSRILSASLDGTARIWDAVGGESMVVLSGHEDGVWFAVWNDDESQVLTASADGTARVWDADTGLLLLSLVGHEDLIHQARWSTDESQIATASDDGTARIWDAATGVQTRIFRHPSAAQAVHWHAADAKILTAGDDGDARIWSIDTMLPDPELPALGAVEGGHAEASWNQDETLVLIAGDNPGNYLRTWNASTGEPHLNLAGHTGEVISADWSADDTLILSASRDKTARVWDAEIGAEVLALRGHDESVIDAQWSQDESRILTNSADGTVRIWDAKSGEILLQIAEHDDWVWQAKWKSDESQILTASVDGTAKLFDAATGRTLMVLPHDAWVGTASWSPDEQLILTVSDDGTAKVWDAESGELFRMFTDHEGEVWGGAWKSDGTQVLTFATDGTIRIWDPAGGEEVLVLSGHADVISDARWNRAETQILSTSQDGTIRIWDAVAGLPLVVIQDGGRFLERSVWNRLETRLLRVGSGGARQYFARMPDLIDEACRRVDRNLTQSEWSRFFGTEPYRNTCPQY